ncbi:alpha/beta fold hydrolase [candidate division KSB1 bacterium]|nr:alpha/beta fold hydrolase [candidate division KSB1 bacterium]RQW03098.1 MAG: alpha/beta fold hydrolase [candidate division KSB1 bacterium]
MKRFLWLLPIFSVIGCSAATYHYSLVQTDASDSFVIILHGLRGKSTSFLMMEKALVAKGYNVCRVDYPSTQDTIERLADTAIRTAIERCSGAGGDTLHFVAHSMGGILVRYYLQKFDVPQLGRVVLLCPPNRGIELIDTFAWCGAFRKYNGPAGMQLSAKKDGFVRSLLPSQSDVGVIMSTKSVNPVASAFIPGPDDGRVAIASARINDLKDFVLVNSNHHVIMKKEETIRQVISFLKNGSFEKD